MYRFPIHEELYEGEITILQEAIAKETVAVEPSDCPVCQGNEASSFVRLSDYEYSTVDQSFAFVSCQRCALLRLNPRPRVDQFNKIYPSNYHPFNFSKGKSIGYWARDLRDRLIIRKYRKYLLPGARVIDVGCGDGGFLKLLKKYGHRSYELSACDLNDAILNDLESEGVRIYAGDFLEQEVPAAYFDFVVCFHTLEHVPDPVSMLKKLASSLKPNQGKLVLQVPTPRGLNWLIFKGKYWSGYHTPRHFWLFCFEHIEQMAKQVGLRVVTARTIPSPGFWMQSILNMLNDFDVRPKIKKHFDINQKPTPFISLVGLTFFTLVDILQSLIFHKTDTLEIIFEKSDI